MRKRLLATLLMLLMLLMVVSLFPATALAEGTTLETTYFPTGKISTPKAAYLSYDGEKGDYGDSIQMWFNFPQELLALAEATSRLETENGTPEE